MNNFKLPCVDYLIEGIHYKLVDYNFAENEFSERRDRFRSDMLNPPGQQTNMPSRGNQSTFAEECGPGEKMIFGMCRKLKDGSTAEKDFDSSKKTKQEEEGEAQAKKEGSEFKNNKMIQDMKTGKKFGWAMKNGKPVLVEWGSVAGEKKVGPKKPENQSGSSSSGSRSSSGSSSSGSSGSGSSGGNSNANQIRGLEKALEDPDLNESARASLKRQIEKLRNQG